MSTQEKFKNDKWLENLNWEDFNSWNKILKHYYFYMNRMWEYSCLHSENENIQPLSCLPLIFHNQLECWSGSLKPLSPLSLSLSLSNI